MFKLLEIYLSCTDNPKLRDSTNFLTFYIKPKFANQSQNNCIACSAVVTNLINLFL